MKLLDEFINIMRVGEGQVRGGDLIELPCPGEKAWTFKTRQVFEMTFLKTTDYTA